MLDYNIKTILITLDFKMNIISILKNILINPKSVFLKNVGLRQTIFKNTFWLGASEVVSGLSKLILMVYVARILGATEFGEFNFAFAYISLFSMIFDFGLGQITTRELASEKNKEKYFPAIFTLKLILSFIALTLIITGSLFVTNDNSTRVIIFILGLYLLFSTLPDIIIAFLRARQKMEYEALVKITQSLFLFLAGWLVIFKCPSVNNLSYSYFISGIASLILILIVFHTKFYPIKLEFNKIIWREFLKMSWPLAVGGIFWTIYTQIDSVMMGYFGQITEVGWYNAAGKIIVATLLFSRLLFTSFYPAMSKYVKISREKLQQTWDYQAEIMLLISIPLVVGGYILAEKIILFLYSSGFNPAIPVFKVLIISAGISFFISSFNQILIVYDKQKTYFWITFAAVIVNIILNIILIPKYSLYGAAATALITSFIMLSFLLIYTFKYNLIKLLNKKFIISFFVALFASIIMYLVITTPFIYKINVILIIIIGTIVYTITYLLTRKIVFSKAHS